MRSLIVATMVAMMVVGCTSQRGLISNAVRRAAQVLEPLFIQNNGADGYRFRYETDEQVREERGYFEGGVWTVKGHFEWLRPDGKWFAQDYIADDKGYRIEEGSKDLIPEIGVIQAPAAGVLSPGALASLTG